MSDKTIIQWCHSTVNSIMGCGGCELFPPPSEVLAAIDARLGARDLRRIGSSRIVFCKLIEAAYERISAPLPGHSKAVTTTNIWHLRDAFVEKIEEELGRDDALAASLAIRQSITCYAAKLHLNKGRSIVDPGRKANSGHAPTFETITRFEGRVKEMAMKRDLLGRNDPSKPWLNGLPRLVFISDMGDAFSRDSDFAFLEAEVIEPIRSADGQRHLWLWLTKRPDRMARFGERIGGFPTNVCAMTTITGPDKLARIDQLRQVPAAVRGLSVEPLWNQIRPRDWNLSGISWLILGGESGARDSVRPFALEWARELRDLCESQGVAFFMKQLGRRPMENGVEFELKHCHGGDWAEWPEDLKIRKMPEAFHRYREQPEMKQKADIVVEVDTPPTAKEKREFERLDKIVKKGLSSVVIAASALAEIRERRLYRGEFPTFEEYCQQRLDMTRQYANRLIAAGKVRRGMETFVSNQGVDLPLPERESVLRELGRLPDAKEQVEVYQEAVAVAGEYPKAAEVAELVAAQLGESPVAITKQGKPPSAPKRIQSAIGILDDYEAGKIPVDQFIATLRDVLLGKIGELQEDLAED